eukprot:871352-Alexandrium_andersonii.AAC.1
MKQKGVHPVKKRPSMPTTPSHEQMREAVELLPSFKIDIRVLDMPLEALPQVKSFGGANYTIKSPLQNGAKIE